MRTYLIILFFLLPAAAFSQTKTTSYLNCEAVST
jgi:hypothetical protein